MPAEARISSIWKKQKFFVSIFLIAFAAYFFYDGLIGYPNSNERWTKYEEYKKAEDMEGWRAFAKQKGWVTEQPHKFFKPSDIMGQFVFGGVLALIGSIVLVYWFTQKGRILRSDEEAVYTPSGTRVPFDAISGLGLKKWDSKGIAVVRYQLNGKKGQFIIDDYKFEPEPTRKIFSEIEERLKGPAAVKAE